MEASNYSSTDSKTSSEDDLVDGQIDPEILKILGIDDVFDLDQGDYMSLLKERILKGSFDEKQKLSEEDLAKLSNERKRIRDKKDIKFTSKKLNKDNFFNTNSEQENQTNTIIDPKKMLPPSGGIDSNNIGKKDDENDDDLKSELESLKNFLKVDLFDAIKDIGSIVKNIESLLEDRNSLLKKESESERKTSVKSGFRGKEDELENKKKESKFGGILSAVTKPFTSLFDTIKNFLMNVLVGSLLNWLISIFQDPRKLLQPIQDLLDGIFNFFNNIIDWMDNTFVNPIRYLIDAVNSGISGFINVLNNALSLIPGASPIEAPKIANIPEPPKLESPDIVGKNDNKKNGSPTPTQPLNKGGSPTPTQQLNKGGSVVGLNNKDKNITNQNILNNLIEKNQSGNITNQNILNNLTEKNEEHNVYDSISDKGGEVSQNTGLTIKGLEPDTQLTALKKDEYVLVPGAAKALGISNLNALNEKYAGSSANKNVFSTLGNAQVLKKQGGGGIDLWGISPSRNSKLNPSSSYSEVPAHHRSYTTEAGLPRDYAVVKTGVNPAAQPNHGKGLNVVAGVSGKVSTAGYHGNAGNMVAITNNSGKNIIRLLHLDKIMTSVGSNVNPNTVIGTQGNTGTKDIHVHVDGSPQVHTNWIRSMLGGNFATGDMTNGDPSSAAAADSDSTSSSSSYDATKAVSILGDPSNPTNKGYLKLSDNIQSDQVNLRSSILNSSSSSILNSSSSLQAPSALILPPPSGSTKATPRAVQTSTKISPVSTPNIPPPPSSRGGLTMLPIPPATNSNPSGIVKSGVLSGGQGSSVPGFSSVNQSELSHIGAVSSVFGVMEN